MSNKPADIPFPTKEQVLEYVRGHKGPVGKREIARAFNIRGANRTRLNGVLRDLREEGNLDKGRGKRFAKPGTLPNVGVIEVIRIDQDGELVARPVNWESAGTPPAVFLGTERKGPAPVVGDRILARLTPSSDGTYNARVIKLLKSAPQCVIGIFQIIAGKAKIIPTNRRIRTEFVIPPGEENGASKGDLVEVHATGGRSFGLPEARIAKVIGDASKQHAPSLIAIHSHDNPFDSVSGSIGTTRSGKYTELPRSLASRSNGLPGRTYQDTSAIATSRCQPPLFFGSESCSAQTASSKSRASEPSMVTSGMRRRSVRP